VPTVARTSTTLAIPLPSSQQRCFRDRMASDPWCDPPRAQVVGGGSTAVGKQVEPLIGLDAFSAQGRKLGPHIRDTRGGSKAEVSRLITACHRDGRQALGHGLGLTAASRIVSIIRQSPRRRVETVRIFGDVRVALPPSARHPTRVGCRLASSRQSEVPFVVLARHKAEGRI
jgi:hypothetical protein